MGTLEQINQLQAQGMTDQEIINTLQQQGISPGEINNAINQLQIKNAVAGERKEMAPPQAGTDQMQPSVMDTQSLSQEMAPPQAGTDQSLEQNYYPTEYPQNFSQETSNYGVDSETIIELAEQVFENKIKKIQLKINELNEIKTLNQVKLEHNTNILNRIEKIIDALQISVLDKVGSYGKDLNTIKKEMSLIENSIGKISKKSSYHKSKK